MSKIAIDARTINSSTGTYIERLLYYLQKIDNVNEYVVLVRAKDEQFWKPTANNFTVMVADFKNYSFAEQFKFKKFLDKLSPDLVHFCMPQQPILYKGTHVTTIHDLTLLKTYNSDKNWLVYHIKQLVGLFVFKAVSKSSIQVITSSEFSKNEILKFTKVNPDKVTVTLLSADIHIDKLSPYKHPYKDFLLYVGRQSDYKNIRRLGDAHQLLLKKYPDLGLILVGRLDKSAVNNEIYFNDKNYKNITFTDFIPDSQRDWLYSKSAAYIFPSLMEGFGLPGLEAMGYGAPVVSSNATCLPEVYQDAACYFNPANISDIAKAINEVLTDNELRSSLINKGYQQLKKYSWQRTANQTYNVYINALKNNK